MSPERALSSPCGSCDLCYNIESDAGWSSLVARRAHNPKVAGSNPAPAIEADQGVGLARALQTGRPRPRRPSVRAAFVVGGRGWGGARGTLSKVRTVIAVAGVRAGSWRGTARSRSSFAGWCAVDLHCG